jgi:hypothetical protein
MYMHEIVGRMSLGRNIMDLFVRNMLCFSAFCFSSSCPVDQQDITGPWQPIMEKGLVPLCLINSDSDQILSIMLYTHHSSPQFKPAYYKTKVLVVQVGKWAC